MRIIRDDRVTITISALLSGLAFFGRRPPEQVSIVVPASKNPVLFGN